MHVAREPTHFSAAADQGKKSLRRESQKSFAEISETIHSPPIDTALFEGLHLRLSLDSSWPLALYLSSSFVHLWEKELFLIVYLICATRLCEIA